MFDGRVIPISENIMLRWRVVLEEGRKRRHTFSEPDLIIAATALEHGLTLVTRNTADYALVRVVTYNPWLD